MRISIIIQGSLVNNSSNSGYSTYDLLGDITNIYPTSKIYWTVWSASDSSIYEELMLKYPKLSILFIPDPGSIYKNGQEYNISRIVQSVINSLKFIDKVGLVLKIRSDMRLLAPLTYPNRYSIGRYFSLIALSSRGGTTYLNGISDCIHFGELSTMRRIWYGIDLTENFVFPEQLVGNSVVRLFNIETLFDLYDYLHFYANEDRYYLYPKRFYRRGIMNFEFHKTVKNLSVRLFFVKISAKLLWIIRLLLRRHY